MIGNRLKKYICSGIRACTIKLFLVSANPLTACSFHQWYVHKIPAAGNNQTFKTVC
jgi:hypothetical protein